MRQWLELGRGQTGEHETCHVRISLLAPALVESFRMNILARIEDKKMAGGLFRARFEFLSAKWKCVEPPMHRCFFYGSLSRSDDVSEIRSK